MTRTTTAVPPARAAAVCRPATRPRPVRYADAVGRIVAGGQPASVRGTTTRGTSVHRSTAPGGAVDRTAAAAGPGARLTRRGRVAVVFLVALVMTVGFSLGRVSSTATPDAGPRPPRPTVVVQPGETLWQIAERAAPGADPRETVWRIAELNDLGGNPTVRAGQQLVLPG
jgi:LysM repeat protein